MKHERILKREDGTRVKILTWAYFDSYGESIIYDHQVEISQPGKKKIADPTTRPNI
jgi:hypothetical protein